jgi:carboxypeptidase C (cathepsin A)
MHLKDSYGNAKASVFYVAYAQQGVDSLNTRPITFCFNGGPGSSAIWLHMGVFGPKRVALEEFGYGQPPYHTISNEFSILDLTDLVFIDPVSTGYSRAAPGEDVKQFHGVEEDVKWVAEFIRQFTTHYGRWESPKFLAGESYGTTRAAAMAAYLHEDMYMFLNGIILISSILDFQAHDKFDRDNDLPFITTLPSLTAAAWYHKKLSPELSKNLLETLKQAEKFALTEYAMALLKGDWLEEAEKQDIIQKVAMFTGLSPAYVADNNLRISTWKFLKELMHEDKRIIGRFDGRYLGIDNDLCGTFMDYDPSADAVFGPFTGAFNAYVRTDLKWKKDDEYKVLTSVFPWNYGKEANNKYLNVSGMLKQVMSRNPACLVFVANGYYDLATPYFSQDYTFKHLDLDPSIKENILISYYEAGHMMYTHPPSLIKMRKDLEIYYHRALQPKPPLAPAG